MKTVHLTPLLYLTVLLAFCVSSPLKAQEEGRRFEVSFHVDNIFSESPGNYQGLSNPYLRDTSVLPSNEQYLFYRPLMAGIGFRYMASDKLSLRARASYYGVFTEGDDSSRVEHFDHLQEFSHNTQVNNLRMNIGAQLQEGFEKGELYYGGDITFSFTDAIYQKSVFQLPTIVLADPRVSRITNKRWAVGLSPYIGVRYYILPRVSLSTEMGFFYEYYHQELKEVNSYKKDHKTSINQGQNMYLGPLGHISVNFLF
jgi:hypothetical protein